MSNEWMYTKPDSLIVEITSKGKGLLSRLEKALEDTGSIRGHREGWVYLEVLDYLNTSSVWSSGRSNPISLSELISWIDENPELQSTSYRTIANGITYLIKENHIVLTGTSVPSEVLE